MSLKKILKEIELGKDFYPREQLEQILYKGYEINNPIKFPLKWLSMSVTGIQNSMDDIRNGKPSRSKDKPIEVYYDVDKNQFILTDGYHRVAELLLKVKYPDQWTPDEYYVMANVHGGYNDTWQNIEYDWWERIQDDQQEYFKAKDKSFYAL